MVVFFGGYPVTGPDLDVRCDLGCEWRQLYVAKNLLVQFAFAAQQCSDRSWMPWAKEFLDVAVPEACVGAGPNGVAYANIGVRGLQAGDCVEEAQVGQDASVDLRKFYCETLTSVADVARVQVYLSNGCIKVVNVDPLWCKGWARQLSACKVFIF